MSRKRLIVHVLAALVILVLLAGIGINAHAKSKVKYAGLSFNQSTKIITVKYKGKAIANVPYKKEIVYANKDITFVRLGPGTSFTKVTTNKVKKIVGDKIIRIGNFCNVWSIVVINGKCYFVFNSYLSTSVPSAKLSVKKYTARQLKRKGVIYWNKWRWTWYSQKVLRGGGLKIPGRHVDKNGYVCDKYGYICLASGRLKKGTIVNTPFGKKGKVYDCGCARNTLDVYTNF